ncbi:MAG: Beta-lactamase domain protein [Parcubacteria group bacterium GW2011_GWD2_42_14]|nr:MAG: Beta-lactamase domain protein [Parcubacteria group bacterium GW2011_GWD2_42_14]
MFVKTTNQTNTYVVWFLMLVLLCACAIIWSTIYTLERDKVLTVAFLDVEQGDAIYIETPHGNQVLIDGGKGRAVLRELGTQMSYFDRSIDMVIATHPDLDHIGGLPEVFKRFDVTIFIESGVEDVGAENSALHEAVQNEGIYLGKARQGMTFMLDTEVKLEILFPDREVATVESNTGSVVVKLTYKNTSFLFTGDSPAGIETYLTSVYGKRLKSNVLKVGHHGSKTSTAEVFLGFVDPEYAVISASCDNPYGHPHQEVLERLERFKAQTVSTCDLGTITFISDGETISR